MIAMLRRWLTPTESPMTTTTVPAVTIALLSYELRDQFVPKMTLTAENGDHIILRTSHWRPVLWAANTLGSWRPMGTDAPGGARGGNPFDTTLSPAGNYAVSGQTASAGDARALGKGCRAAHARLVAGEPSLHGANPVFHAVDDKLCGVLSERGGGVPVVGSAYSLGFERTDSALALLGDWLTAHPGAVTIHHGVPSSFFIGG